MLLIICNQLTAHLSEEWTTSEQSVEQSRAESATIEG